jgi:hypothetical protein
MQRTIMIRTEDPTWHAQSAAPEEADRARRDPSRALAGKAGKICKIRVAM